LTVLIDGKAYFHFPAAVHATIVAEAAQNNHLLTTSYVCAESREANDVTISNDFLVSFIPRLLL